MKNIFVVLPLNTENYSEEAYEIAHEVEKWLDEYCQLIPSIDLPRKFACNNSMKPLDWLSSHLSYMLAADVVVFTEDWETYLECKLLHNVAESYNIPNFECNMPDESEGELTACPHCGEYENLTISCINAEDTNKFAVKCMKCGASGAACDSEKKAVKAWNKRR